MSSKVELRAVGKTFGPVTALHDISFSVESRELVVLVGPSGCGKSTLLRLVAGLEPISSGELSIDGRVVNAVPASERGLAMVFQSYALYPHMSVADNLSVGLRIARTDRATIARKVAEVAATLQLDGLLERLPKHLSGGQRQRVAIGRAIVREPEVFLFDEPLSNLDASLRLQMRVEIARLHGRLNATMIYVTHDQVEAMTLADRIVVLNAGRIEQVGSPLSLYRSPVNTFVAEFLGSPKMNLLGGRAGSTGAERLGVDLDAGGSVVVDLSADLLVTAPPAAGSPVRVGIRPESIALAAADGTTRGLRGQVSVVERLGGQTIVYVDVPGERPVTVVTDAQARVRVGDTVSLQLPTEALLLFDDDGHALNRIRDRTVA